MYTIFLVVEFCPKLIFFGKNWHFLVDILSKLHAPIAILYLKVRTESKEQLCTYRIRQRDVENFLFHDKDKKMKIINNIGNWYFSITLSYRGGL